MLHTLPVYLCLCLTSVKMYLWSTFPNIFFTNLMRRSMLRNWWSCTTQGRWPNLPWGYQETRQWMQWNMHYTWEKLWISHYWKWTNFSVNSPLLVWLSWNLLPNLAGESHERIEWPCNQLIQDGGSRIWPDRISLTSTPWERRIMWAKFWSGLSIPIKKKKAWLPMVILGLLYPFYKL